MSKGKYAIIALLVIAIPGGISTFTTNIALAYTCNRGAHSCANTNLLPNIGCCVIAASSGIHVTAKGQITSGPGALTNNKNSIEIIATPSANINPGGHTIAQANGQSAHTSP